MIGEDDVDHILLFACLAPQGLQRVGRGTVTAQGEDLAVRTGEGRADRLRHA